MICNNCGKNINDGISFCPSCGNYVNKTSKVFATVEKKEKKKKKLLEVSEERTNKTGKIIYLIIIFLWLGAIYFIIDNVKKDYYFDEDNSKIENTDQSVIDNELPEGMDYEGTSKSGVKGISGIGTTAIVHDNQYFKQMTFNNVNDVYDLIKYDSLKQKTSCPAAMKGIEDEIISKYEIVAINFCEMDLDFAYELKDVINYIYVSYPTARGYLTNMTLANVGENTTYMAAFMPLFTFGTSNTSNGYPVAYKTQIILNAKYFADAEKINNSVSYGASSGYFPKGATRSSTIVHEFAHYLSYVAMLNYYKTSGFTLTSTSMSNTLYKVYEDFNDGNFSYKVIKEAYEKYSDKNRVNFDDFRGKISKYAIAKDKTGAYIYDETIAEAFHDCYLNGDKASEPSKLIVSTLIGYL